MNYAELTGECNDIMNNFVGKTQDISDLVFLRNEINKKLREEGIIEITYTIEAFKRRINKTLEEMKIESM